MLVLGSSKSFSLQKHTRYQLIRTDLYLARATAAFVFVSIGTLRKPLHLPDTTTLQRNTGLVLSPSALSKPEWTATPWTGGSRPSAVKIVSVYGVEARSAGRKTNDNHPK
ncbi:hypothetical protein FP744_10008772 [Trichoderma asperellum]